MNTSMKTRTTAARYLALAILGFVQLWAGCNTNTTGLNGGKTDAGKSSDVRATTCQQDGKTYAVGATVVLNVCTSCICLQDGTVGQCTGACAPDAGDKDLASNDTAGPGNACTQAGGSCVAVTPGACASGTLTSSLTCGSGVGSTCCMPGGAGGSSGSGGSSGRGGNSGTGGTTSVPANACTKAGGSCVAVAPGSCASGTITSLSCGPGIGSICCMPGKDGGIDGGAQTLAALCTMSGGKVASSSCCASTSDFPDMCLVGGCSCSPASSKPTSICDCGSGSCFSQTLGCVSR